MILGTRLPVWESAGSAPDAVRILRRHHHVADGHRVGDRVGNVEALEAEARNRLEALAGLTGEDAKKELIAAMLDEARAEAAMRVSAAPTAMGGSVSPFFAPISAWPSSVWPASTAPPTRSASWSSRTSKSSPTSSSAPSRLIRSASRATSPSMRTFNSC